MSIKVQKEYKIFIEGKTDNHRVSATLVEGLKPENICIERDTGAVYQHVSLASLEELIALYFEMGDVIDEVKRRLKESSNEQTRHP